MNMATMALRGLIAIGHSALTSTCVKVPLDSNVCFKHILFAVLHGVGPQGQGEGDSACFQLCLESQLHLASPSSPINVTTLSFLVMQLAHYIKPQHNPLTAYNFKHTITGRQIVTVALRVLQRQATMALRGLMDIFKESNKRRG
jgi:hypothetical protein